MNRITVLRTLLSCAAAFVALTATGQARALDTYPAFMCHVAQHDYPHVLRTVPYGIENNSGEPNSRNMIIACPVPGDGAQLAGIGATFFDGNSVDTGMLGEFQIQGCATSTTAQTFSCSRYDALRNPDPEREYGTHYFELDTEVLAAINSQRSGYRYLNVSIPRAQGSSRSRFYGYQVR
jgi:hypothetical protein